MQAGPAAPLQVATVQLGLQAELLLRRLVEVMLATEALAAGVSAEQLNLEGGGVRDRLGRPQATSQGGGLEEALKLMQGGAALAGKLRLRQGAVLLAPRLYRLHRSLLCCLGSCPAMCPGSPDTLSDGCTAELRWCTAAAAALLQY